MYKEPVMELLKDCYRKDLSSLLGFLRERVVDQPFYACVTNDNELVLGKRFFTLNQKQRTFAILHELLHISYGHFKFYKAGVNHKVMNIANDAVINEAILLGKIVPVEYVQAVDGIPLFKNTVYRNKDNLVAFCKSYYGNLRQGDLTDGWFKRYLTSSIVYKVLMESPVPEVPKFRSRKSNSQNSQDTNQNTGSDDNNVKQENNDEYKDEHKANGKEDNAENTGDEESTGESGGSDYSSDRDYDETECDGQDSQDSRDSEADIDPDDESDQDDETQSDDGSDSDDELDQDDEAQSNNESQNSDTQGEQPDPLQYEPVAFDLESLGQEYQDDFDGASNPFEVYKNCDGQFDNSNQICGGLSSDEAYENGYNAYLVKEALSRNIDWKSVVKTCIAQSKKTIKQYGFSVPNRRNYKLQQVTQSKVQLPNQCSTQPVPTVHIYVDTSTSVSDYSLACMIYEIKDIYKFSGNIDLTVRFFTEYVYGEMNTKANTFNYRNMPKLRRGGTSFNAIYAQYYSPNGEVHHKIPDVCVVITDGYCWIDNQFLPLPLGRKTVWVTDRTMRMPNPKCINVVRPF